ncbi:hypothetical protein A2763_03290 [Candidatus Kaiserbacteria bacterium RIFCSPHIGHO2_01_FULL_54_36]|uniref:Thioredoxin domain-containing protein n=1 Tax=Candidatus Kaiserbacteria bacterium RIFCSPHIGHO2_01_FULL_54_36 TaxID=1798482 RepID=A0A1F6CKC4_9BACT|nr:MAG: hypothetical protein A2763_03290 [Candidatus Kaiserbacteria bacterium RIFCSPHIGHO2_01_FULL_54_36]OGG75423.1 MAG: hypothetical protein A3A41_02545 [Candidatus Kaiserbacteria bacterium RIFCSPLOWO2_01_FULL_54_22]
MPTESARDTSKLYLPVAIVAAGALIAGGLYLGLSSQSAAPAPGGQPQANVDIKDVSVEGSPYIGDANAKVVLAYWSDYQCPYCKAVEMGHAQIPIEPALPILIKDYVDTGKLKIVFKDYPFLSEDSTTAALYGRAVWALYPQKYWEWREAMYKAQDEEHAGFGNEATIVTLMRGISGIDADRVKADVAGNRAQYQALLDADREEGTKFGINGTPGFITGKVLIGGAAEVSSFKSAIDPQL